jgi:hypothetical protein
MLNGAYLSFCETTSLYIMFWYPSVHAQLDSMLQTGKCVLFQVRRISWDLLMKVFFEDSDGAGRLYIDQWF